MPILPVGSPEQPQIAGAVKSPGNSLSNFLNRRLTDAASSAVTPDVVGAVRDVFGLTGTASGQPEAIGGIFGEASPRGPRRPKLNQNLSQWGHISEHLLAQIYPITKPDQESVAPILAPASDMNFDASFNWQSPFENTGPESKAPALMALIQSGQIGIIVNSLQALIGKGESGTVVGDAMNSIGEVLNAGAEKAKRFAEGLEGRTGITRLNSRQVFTGMPPISITLTLHLRAFQNAAAEVQDPYRKLLEWSLPVFLAQQGAIANTAQAVADDSSIISALFPSTAPTFVGLRYAKNRYEPMVIESVSNPIDGHIGEDGIPVYRAVQIKLATLTALDRTDVAKILMR